MPNDSATRARPAPGPLAQIPGFVRCSLSLVALCLVALSQSLAQTSTSTRKFITQSAIDTGKGIFIEKDSVQNLPDNPAAMSGVENQELEGSYIVIHKQPALLAVAPNPGKAAAGQLAGAKAVSLAANALRAIDDEQAAFLRELGAPAQAGAIVGGAIKAAGLRVRAQLRKASNITVIDNLKKEDAARLRRAGHDIRPDVLFKVSLYDSVTRIGADQVWNQLDGLARNITGAGTRVGVIDTGIDYTHPSLGACSHEQFRSGTCQKVPGGKNFIDPAQTPFDDGYHGTHVSGTIAGNGLLKGVAPDATLYALKVCYGSGSCPYSAILEAIDWAVDPNSDNDTSDHLDVINLSLGGGGNPDDELSKAIDQAVDAGVVAVISAGNSGPGAQTVGSPGTARKAITVGAAYARNEQGSFWGDNNPVADQVTAFSSRGPVIWHTNAKKIVKPDVLAPGAFICAARSSSDTSHSECRPGYAAMSGTSMAAPHVAGVAALLRQAYPQWTPLQLKHALRSTADRVTMTNPRTNAQFTIFEQGHGRVNVLKALAAGPEPIVAEVTTEGTLQGAQAPIIGTALGGNFQSYSLSFRAAGPNEWIPISVSNLPVDNGVLGLINLSSLGSGDYEVALMVQTATSSYTSYSYFKIANTLISSPVGLLEKADWRARTLYPVSDPIVVTGTAQGLHFRSFNLEWCPTDANLRPIPPCSTNGVTLNNGGSSAVPDGWLAMIDFSGISGSTSGFYAIKLTAEQQGRPSEVAYATIYVDTALKSGYPHDFPYPGNGMFILSLLEQPLLADVDGDGGKDIVFAYGDKIEAHDSQYNPLPGWPYYLPNGGYTQTPPSIGDIDGDGRSEIIASSIQPVAEDSYERKLSVFRANGTLAPGWPGSPSGGSWFGNPRTLIDLNSDHLLDLLEYDLAPQDINKNVPAGWYWNWTTGAAPRQQAWYWADAVAATQGSGAGGTRVYAVSRQQDKQMVFAFSGLGQTLWSRPISGNNYFSEPTTVDLNADGLMDVVFTQVQNLNTAASVTLHAYLHNGDVAPGFPATYTPCTDSTCRGWIDYTAIAPSVADIDLDGIPEIAFIGSPEKRCTGSYCMRVECIRIYDGKGRLKNSICGDFNRPWSFNYSVELANADDDPELEIIPGFSGMSGQGYGPGYANTVGALPAFNLDGTMAKGFPKVIFDLPLSQHRPIADIDNDGKNDLVLVSGERIYAWNLDACASESEEFGQHGGDATFKRQFKPVEPFKCKIALPPPTPTPAPVPITLSGVVRDQYGNIIANATVTLLISGQLYITTTDAQGRFIFSGVLGRGAYVLSVQTPTMELKELIGNLNEDTEINPVVQPRKFVVSAKVVNRRMLPVSAPVSVSINGQPMSYNSASGSFVAEVDYGSTYALQASGTDGVGFLYSGASGTILGEVGHVFVRDSWEEQ